MGLSLVRAVKPIDDVVLASWLKEFRKKSTRKNYCSALRCFQKCLGFTSFGEYLRNKPDGSADLKKFLLCLEGRPPKTIGTYCTAVRSFFMDNGVMLAEVDLRRMRRRGFMPKRVRASTRDKKPGKLMLKKILNHGSLMFRALCLYLLSSGARVGESLQLVVGDFDFKADPPRAHIRGEITKFGVGERTVYFSYEARDTILDWLKAKEGLRKRDGSGRFDSNLVFPVAYVTFWQMWNKACDKAGYGQRDPRTKRRIYHIHTLRKFFRSNVGLDLDVVHALMGHGEYLDDAYLRLDEQGEVAKQYLACMENVSVFAVVDSELRERTEAIAEDNELLRRELDRLKHRQKDLDELLSVLRDPEKMRRFKRLMES